MTWDKPSREILSIVVDDECCQAAASWELIPSTKRNTGKDVGPK